LDINFWNDENDLRGAFEEWQRYVIEVEADGTNRRSYPGKHKGAVNINQWDISGPAGGFDGGRIIYNYYFTYSKSIFFFKNK